MRSALVVLALSMPVMAFASPTYSSPLRTWSAHNKPAAYQQVSVEFFNSMPEPCDLHLSGKTIAVPAFRSVRLHVPVDASVTVSSQYDSHLSKEVLHASMADEGRTILVH